MKTNSLKPVTSTAHFRFGVFLVFAFLLLTPFYLLLTTKAIAQEEQKLAITIAPPLYQLSIAPGTTWKSTLKVVNTNHYPLTIYAHTVNFHPDGETGNAVFDEIWPSGERPLTDLASWITVPADGVPIPADQTGDIPISVAVPADANPGGHYAAILVGTKPPDKVAGGGAAIGTLLSSLVFLRVPGDVVEEGSIRDFYTEDTFTEDPDQVFTLRFENKGNVHLVPQGQIVITNMWGKERGRLVVNEKNTFGNILPGSTRKFKFEWKSEPSVFDIGRYKAEAMLSFGELSKHSDTRMTYFWVVPWKPVSGLLLGIFCFIVFMKWAIRRYVRRALKLERERLGLVAAHHETNEAHFSPVQHHHRIPKLTLSTLKRPLIEGVRDISGKRTIHMATLKAEHDKEEPYHPRKEHWTRRLKRYRLFFASAAIFALGLSMIGWYFVEVLRDENIFTVSIVREK